jgi:hypothetical protein
MVGMWTIGLWNAGQVIYHDYSFISHEKQMAQLVAMSTWNPKISGSNHEYGKVFSGFSVFSWVDNGIGILAALKDFTFILHNLTNPGKNFKWRENTVDKLNHRQQKMIVPSSIRNSFIQVVIQTKLGRLMTFSQENSEFFDNFLTFFMRIQESRCKDQERTSLMYATYICTTF